MVHRSLVSPREAAGAPADGRNRSGAGAGPGAGAIRHTAAWHPTFALGIDRIDEQHRGLFLLHDDFVHAIERGGSVHIVDRIAGELGRYIAFHFRDEEDIMERVGYDELRRHQALHDGLRHMVSRLSDLPREQGSLLVVAEFVRLWIRQHILVEDADLARFLRTRKA